MRIVAILIGLLFGSLGSVLLIRLSEKVDRETIKGILRGRSQCPNCGTTLKASNLIPLVSFLRQGGKCKHCKQKISSLYPILEIGSAIMFVVSFLVFEHMGMGTIVFRCLVHRLFFLLIVYDVMKYELHVPLRMMLTIVLAGGSLFGIGGTLTQALVSMGLFAIGFGIIFFLAKRYAKARYGASEGFGQGDVYLGATLGLGVPLVVSYNHLSRGGSSLVNIFLLFIILSSIIGIVLRMIVRQIVRQHVTSQINKVSPLFQDKLLIPFIPAMIVAFWILLWKADFFISLLFPLG